jgi:hypothetical protein
MGGTYPEDVAVTIESSASALRAGTNGIVIIPAGSTSAVVPLQPMAQAENVTLTARLDNSVQTATVRVLGETEQPMVSALLPTSPVTTAGGQVRFTVRLDRPAPAGTLVDLTVSPEGFGSVGPASVATNGMEAVFHFTADAAPAVTEGTVTAAVGATNGMSATVTIAASVPKLDTLTPSTAVLVLPGATQAFTVTLDAPALYDTSVELAATPDTAGATFGTVPAVVVVPTGQTSASFTFAAGSQENVNGMVKAMFDGVERSTQVQVGATPPRLISLTPPSPTVPSGGTQAFTVTLDRPALGNTSVALTLAPASGAGTVPASVTIPAGATSATFDFIAEGTPTSTSATLTATLNGVTQSAALRIVVTVPGLVINEIDYDQPGSDTAEFIEIYNSSSQTLSLTGLKLVYINGSASPPVQYNTGVDLSAATELLPGQYLLVGVRAVLDTVSSPNVKEIQTSHTIQNGNPDAVGIYDTVHDALVDSLSYGGQTAPMVIGTASLNFQEGTEATTNLKDITTNTTANGAGSLSRLPNGVDSNINAADFKFTSAVTPGAPNVLSP